MKWGCNMPLHIEDTLNRYNNSYSHYFTTVMQGRLFPFPSHKNGTVFQPPEVYSKCFQCLLCCLPLFSFKFLFSNLFSLAHSNFHSSIRFRQVGYIQSSYKQAILLNSRYIPWLFHSSVHIYLSKCLKNK